MVIKILTEPAIVGACVYMCEIKTVYNKNFLSIFLSYD